MRAPVLIAAAALMTALAGSHGPLRADAGTARSASSLCDAAARTAAREAGIPPEIMLALTRTETGRRRDGALAPWPWTVNMEGEGRWFDDPDEALAFVETRRKGGARSFDIGCFQINHRWHGDAFGSVNEMFDPLANARYAARFLNEIRAESAAHRDDWGRIAGAYHSRTPSFAKRYRDRFARILEATRRRDGDGRAAAPGAPRAIIPLGAGQGGAPAAGRAIIPPGSVGLAALSPAAALRSPFATSPPSRSP